VRPAGSLQSKNAKTEERCFRMPSRVFRALLSDLWILM
jgi:hypothetical protein